MKRTEFLGILVIAILGIVILSGAIAWVLTAMTWDKNLKEATAEVPEVKWSWANLTNMTAPESLAEKTISPEPPAPGGVDVIPVCEARTVCFSQIWNGRPSLWCTSETVGKEGLAGQVPAAVLKYCGVGP